MTEQPPAAVNFQLQPVQNRGWRLWFSRHNWPTWLGLCFILPLVLYYWQHYNEHLRQQQWAVFQQYANNIEEELQQRLKHIELLLGANVAYVSSSEYVSQPEWQHYVESLKLPQLYPGIQALGVVSYRRAAELPVLLGQLTQELQQQLKQQSVSSPPAPQPSTGVFVHPAGERPTYAIVSHIQPATAQNSQVLGYDMFTDPMRMQTALRAASLNQPAITAKVTLHQDSANQPQPGLVLMLPLYQSDLPLLTAEQKQAALKGFVYAAFRVADILPAAWRDPGIVLPDIRWNSGAEVDLGQLLFHRSSEIMPQSTGRLLQRQSLDLQQHRHLDWYGQPFVLHIKSNPLFEREVLPLAEYELVLLGSVALVLLFLLLSYLNLRRYQTECHSSQLQQHVQQQRQLLLLDEQRQSLALKASQLAWFEFDLRSGGAFYADLWWRMFDFSAPQPNPEPQQLFDILHPSALALFRQDLQRLLAHGPDQDQQHYRFVSRQGRQLYCLVNFYVVRAPEGDAIRLCCTMQDQTLQQQRTETRCQLAAFCQRDLSLVLAQCAATTSSTSSEAFLQQHLRWLLQFYCEAIADMDDPHNTKHHLPLQQQPLPQPLQPLMQLLAEVVQFYQPQVSAKGVQLHWQPQSISELHKLDHHRGWQMACAMLELVLILAKPGSTVKLELQSFQTRQSFSVQLQLTDITTQQCAAEFATFATHPASAKTVLQQRLQVADFWASQLAAEFSYQQTYVQDQQLQQLSLQLLLPVAG